MKISGGKGYTFMEFFKDFFPEAFENEAVIYYEGEINHEITKALTYTAEQHLGQNGATRVEQKKIFNVMVECLQNIDKHAEVIDYGHGPNRKGGIQLADLDDEYCILAGNVVDENQKKPIEKSIREVNKHQKQNLRDMYKKQLSEGRLSEKGGAGLGFIDMARKSGNPIGFAFYPIGKGYYFLVLKFSINKTTP